MFYCGYDPGLNAWAAGQTDLEAAALAPFPLAPFPLALISSVLVALTIGFGLFLTVPV